jgi:hypothetical protein
MPCKPSAAARLGKSCLGRSLSRPRAWGSLLWCSARTGKDTVNVAPQFLAAVQLDQVAHDRKA